jgi:hypothetical protein
MQYLEKFGRVPVAVGGRHPLAAVLALLVPLTSCLKPLKSRCQWLPSRNRRNWLKTKAGRPFYPSVNDVVLCRHTCTAAPGERQIVL